MFCLRSTSVTEGLSVISFCQAFGSREYWFMTFLNRAAVKEDLFESILTCCCSRSPTQPLRDWLAAAATQYTMLVAKLKFQCGERRLGRVSLLFPLRKISWNALKWRQVINNRRDNLFKYASTVASDDGDLQEKCHNFTPHWTPLTPWFSKTYDWWNEQELSSIFFTKKVPKALAQAGEMQSVAVYLKMQSV